MSLDDWFTPSEDYYQITIAGLTVRFGKSMYERTLTHPKIVQALKDSDYITIEELVNLSESQLAYLISENQCKIINSHGSAKEKQKPKQQIPYWANNWRKK